MRTAYFDCLNGASGILFLASLIDAGASASKIEKIFLKAGLGDIKLSVSKGRAGHIGATQLCVKAPEGPSERSISQIFSIVRKLHVSDRVRASALLIYRLLAEAESKVHGMDPRRVHFHELGRARSLVGVIGTLAALEDLSARRIHSSRLALSEGWMRGSHGCLPAPAPATLELLKGLPLKGSSVCGELITPTGAALIKGLKAKFGPPAKFRLDVSGYGVDERNPALWVRVLIGAEN